MLNKIKSMFGFQNGGLIPQESQQLRPKRSYKSGNHKAFLAGENNRHTYSWSNYKFTADEIIYRFHRTLVARSCEQCMNNPYARKFLIMLKTNVIGPDGIRLNMQAKDPNGALDKLANDLIEQNWQDWGNSCEITGNLDWVQFQSMVERTKAREGEAIVRFIKSRTYAGKYGFGLQLIDTKRLDVNYNINNLSGNFIRFGIEYTPYGKPVNYYFTTNNLDIYGVSQNYGNKYEVVPAEEILHIFDKEFIDQKRGLPEFSSVLMRMNMLAGYEEAAVEYARAAACQMGFLINKDVENIDSDDEEEISIDAEPASFPVLPPGYDLKEFSPSYPKGEFDPFSKAILRGISSGIGASYNTLANDLSSVNFSSLRQGALDERDFWKTRQKTLISQLHEPIFQEWIKHCLLYGYITMPNGKALPVEKIDKFRMHNWQPRSWQWVDPVKDVNAAISSIDSGLRSRSDIIREQGRDPEDVWTEIQKENELLKSKGITVKNQIIQEAPADGTSNV